MKNPPNCPKCGKTKYVQWVTATFTYWELDEEGNTTGNTEEYPDESGKYSHFFCEDCSKAFGGFEE